MIAICTSNLSSAGLTWVSLALVNYTYSKEELIFVDSYQRYYSILYALLLYNIKLISNSIYSYIFNFVIKKNNA